MAWVWDVAQQLRSGGANPLQADEDEDDEGIAELELLGDEGDEGEEGDEGDNFFDPDLDEEITSCSSEDERQQECVVCGKGKGIEPRWSCARLGCPSTCHASCAEGGQHWFCNQICA